MNIKKIINDSSKILVVAPHPDDELIGCFGILNEYGTKTDVLLLTDGQLGKPYNSNTSTKEIIKIRKNEFKNVCKCLKVNKLIYANIKDGCVAENITNVKINDKYDLIFIPYRFDKHKDHSCVYNYFRKQFKKTNLIEYEVWTPLIHPNLYINIEDAFTKKIELLSLYESQLKIINYFKLVEGLSIYRGFFNKCNYAEAYHYDGKYKIFKSNKLLQKLIILLIK